MKTIAIVTLLVSILIPSVCFADDPVWSFVDPDGSYREKQQRRVQQIQEQTRQMSEDMQRNEDRRTLPDDLSNSDSHRDASR